MHGMDDSAFERGTSHLHALRRRRHAAAMRAARPASCLQPWLYIAIHQRNRRRREAMTSTLQGKVAIVTGAARGIGAAIARRFCAEGAAVVINDLDLVGAEKLAAELGGGCLALAADVSDSTAVRAMFAQVCAKFLMRWESTTLGFVAKGFSLWTSMM